jgi:hypothetical protein
VGLKHLIAVEKWTYLLAAVALAGGLLLLPLHAAFSLAVGAALTTLNAVAIRQVGQRIGAVLKQRPVLTIVLFNLKLGVLIALIWMVMRYLHVQPVPFLIGISMLPLAILIVGVQHSRHPETVDDQKEPHG